MICFYDNDIIHKLAAFDLFAEARDLLGAGGSDSYVLPTARFKFGLNKDPRRGEQRYGNVEYQRIREFIEAAKKVERIALEDEVLLAGVLGIDAGEAILLSGAARLPGSCLITGDKKCLTALLRDAACAPLVERLAGRVLCLEQIVIKAIGKFGFEAIKRKIVPASSCDTAIRAAFGSGMRAVESEVLQALAAYSRELRNHPAKLMMPW